MLKFNNKVLNINGNWLNPNGAPEPPEPPVDPYNPLNLPPNTVRVRTDGNVPQKRSGYTSYETATLVPGTTDVYDVYKSGTDFSYLLFSSANVIEVLGANTTGITNMQYMFYGNNLLTNVALFDTSSVIYTNHMFMDCRALTTVPLFDTSNVTNMYAMLAWCSSLTYIPLFNTSKVTDIGWAFQGCTSVESGALALYQQASSQTTPPANHEYCFKDCGTNTQTGSAELAQIPSDWK